MFKKLAEKLQTGKNKKAVNGKMINPLEVNFDTRKNMFLNKLTKQAVELYERQSDIKKFTKMVLAESNQEELDDLFRLEAVDPHEDVKLAHLSDNSKFLRDLGLQ